MKGEEQIESKQQDDRHKLKHNNFFKCKWKKYLKDEDGHTGYKKYAVYILIDKHDL